MPNDRLKVTEVYRSAKTQRLTQKGITVVKNPGDEVDVSSFDHTQVRRMLSLGLLTKELVYDVVEEALPTWPPVKPKK